MKFSCASLVLFTVSFTSPVVFSWGSKGHEIIGAIASEFLTSNGTEFVRQILPGETLKSVATWADIVKAQKRYKFTRNFHYINTNDNPPKNCSFDDMRDCKDGRCLVGAIAKYTNEFLCSKKTSLLDKGIALKFLVHFIGDLSQPLHVSGREYGGHKTQVKYRGRSVTLHSIFDHHIPKGRIRNFNGSEYHYTDYLVRVIHQEQNKGLHTSWLTSYNVFDQSKLGNSMAAIDFARDSNRLSCTGIWSAYDANPRQDFSYQYYRYGSTLVDRQLAKAGYRLAFWINQLSLMTQDDQYCLSASLRLPILYSVWLGLAIQVMFMLVF